MTIIRRNSPTGEMLSLRQAMDRLSEDLPRGLKTEAAVASFDNGLLRLSIPKTEESKPRQIRITPGETPAEQNGKQS